MPPPTTPTLFPYTTLFRSADEERDEEERRRGKQQHVEQHLARALLQTRLPDQPHQLLREPELLKERVQRADAREAPVLDQCSGRSEERRVGKGGRARWWQG